jgi:hypothetical protein
MIPGSLLFTMKTTHGLPLEFSLTRLFDDLKTIDWRSFIDAARENGWYDFQTYRVFCEGLIDADVPASLRAAFISDVQRYIMETLA